MEKKMNIQESLKMGIDLLKKYNIKNPSLKCKILLSHLIGKPKEYLIIHLTDNLKEEIQTKYEEMLEKLIQNVPLQYITNTQEFMGLSFYVDKNVLIPRADTEILVEEVLKRVNKNEKVKVLDMCTGSGAIAVALAKNLENAQLTAVDISKNAINVAKKNATANQVEIKFIESNMFEEVCGKFNIIVSNPPYIETQTIENLEEQVKKEPVIALDGGKDGLKFYSLLAKNAKQHLEKNGILAVEIGYNQRNAVMQLFTNEGYIDCNCIKDLSGNDRVVVCYKK